MTDNAISPQNSKQGDCCADPPDGTRIAGTLRIGVTGHRLTDHAEEIARAVREILNKLREEVTSEAGDIPFTFAVVSSLAEGSDRIVASEVLKTVMPEGSGQSWLEAILPLPISEYERDFAGEASVAEFRSLISMSSLVKTLPKGTGDSRPRAYQRASRLIVDSCDVLIAVWDGKEGDGPGGTADTVEYAKTRNARVYLIPEQKPADFSVFKEGSRWTQFADNLRRIDRFNREPVAPKRLERAVEAYCKRLASEAKASEVIWHEIADVCSRFVPVLIKADLLSLRCRRLYSWVGAALYWFSALAVLTVAVQTLFFAHLHKLLYLEVCFMAIILILLTASRRLHWQERWIDYRFLAERLRAGLFLRISGICIERPVPPAYMSLSHSQDDWMVSAFAWVWNQVRRLPNQHQAGLRRFIKSAWVDDQAIWYRSMSNHLGRRHRLLAVQGYVLFALTLVAGLLHALHISPSLSETLALFAIALPAIGSALAGIREHRDIHKNSARYGEMARHLENIGQEMELAENAAEFSEALNHANETMLGEHQDWRVVILFHRLEPT